MWKLALLLWLALGGLAQAQQSVVVPATTASVALTMSTATTTRFVTGATGQQIYVTQWNFLSAGTTNVTLVTGTGTNCATGQTSLTGAYTATANGTISVGAGNGAVLVVPAGQDLCVTNSQAIVIGGSIAYSRF